jgi:serine/threonine-protein kinase
VAAATRIPPDTLLGGKIRLLSRIGRGGMGDVWIARNEATQAEVAVKTLHRSERTAVHDERFRREARLAATISHRNVVRIFDLVDEEDGTLGLVMELLRGGTLETTLRERGALTTREAVAVAVPVLSALHHVHEKGIIHRDVKPSNVFFAVESDGHVIPKILDFGIAKLPAAGSPLTVDGSVLGTPHYMSPEQIRGQGDIDGRSDMFSLAVVLYEMLTGQRVFQRDSAAASLAAVLEHEVDPDPRIEPRLWIALSRALAKRPYERHASCAAFADALRAALDLKDDDLAHTLQELRPSESSSPEVDAAPSSEALRVALGAKGRRRAFLLATVAAAVGAVCAVIVAIGVMRSGPPPAHAEEGPKLAVQPPPPPTSTSESAPPPPIEIDPAPATPAVKPESRGTVPAPAAKPTVAPKKKGVATTPGF